MFEKNILSKKKTTTKGDDASEERYVNIIKTTHSHIRSIRGNRFSFGYYIFLNKNYFKYLWYIHVM